MHHLVPKKSDAYVVTIEYTTPLAKETFWPSQPKRRTRFHIKLNDVASPKLRRLPMKLARKPSRHGKNGGMLLSWSTFKALER